MTTKCDRNVPETATEIVRRCAPSFKTDGIEARFPIELSDTVVVGDLDSDAPGSGARKNAGKAQMDLVPVRFWATQWHLQMNYTQPSAQLAYSALIALQQWQEGDDGALGHYLTGVTDLDMTACVAVFEFGAKKYKAWNWAKGMQWSVPTGCILRHTKAIIVKGEKIDPESNLPHYAHILCNLIMLAYYVDNYPAGDDRPPSLELT